MNLIEALEICTTRQECGRGCINCRFKGNDCVKIHRKVINEIKRAERERKEREVK